MTDQDIRPCDDDGLDPAKGGAEQPTRPRIEDADFTAGEGVEFPEDDD